VASSDIFDHERLAEFVDEQADRRSVATLVARGVLAAKIFAVGCSPVRGGSIGAQLEGAALVNRVSNRRLRGAVQ
jgi:hypothetical protein